MDFRTEINISKYDFEITYNSNIISLGSCFADNIGDYLQKLRFCILKNPFGVLYNPVSVYNALLNVDKGKVFTIEDLVFNQDEYHSFFHHSDFSHHDPKIVLENINQNQIIVKEFLKKTDVVFITYGTSFVYESVDQKYIVSNCHKIAASKFRKYMLRTQEVTDNIKETIKLLKRYNKNIKIIFTVSPIRHWKDGAVDNHVSKSKLLMGIINSLKKDVYYFPSYEIVNDDLRDYRFYKKDMIHPNEVAVEYIWGKLTQALFGEETLMEMKRFESIENARNHRPRNIKSKQHQKFVIETIRKIVDLKLKYPYTNIDEDIKYFKDQLMVD